MVKRGISENGDYDRWCYYLEPAISSVFQKTIGSNNIACAWRTDDSLWIRESVNWTFRNYGDLTDAEIKEFCRIHDIMDLVSSEVYGESRVKLNLTDEVEFMDI